MSFEKWPSAEKKSDIELLTQAIKEYLENYKTGDFIIGSDAFARTIIIRAWGRLRFNNLSARDFQTVKTKINRILTKIKQKQEQKLKYYINDARRQQERELKRSGGIDPNEI